VFFGVEEAALQVLTFISDSRPFLGSGSPCALISREEICMVPPLLAGSVFLFIEYLSQTSELLEW